MKVCFHVKMSLSRHVWHVWKHFLSFFRVWPISTSTRWSTEISRARMFCWRRTPRSNWVSKLNSSYKCRKYPAALKQQLLLCVHSGLWCKRSVGPHGGTKEHVHRDAVLDGSWGHRLWWEPRRHLRLQGISDVGLPVRERQFSAVGLPDWIWTSFKLFFVQAFGRF